MRFFIVLSLFMAALAAAQTPAFAQKQINFAAEPMNSLIGFAEAGEIGAMVELANRFMTGNGIETNKITAFLWYQRAKEEMSKTPYMNENKKIEIMGEIVKAQLDLRRNMSPSELDQAMRRISGRPPLKAASSPKPGDTYKITKNTKSSFKSPSSSGGSQDRDTLIERVIALYGDGIEFEYDLPETTSDKERERQWQFPVRVFRPFSSSPMLLNTPELEARLETWLKTFKIPRSACGHTFFSLDVFRIECDPQSAIKTIESFDLGVVHLREGASYEDAAALEAGKLVKKSDGPDNLTFAAELSIDSGMALRARAEADVTLGEMMNKPVTLDEALSKRAKETVTGTISVVFDAAPDGKAYRRTKVTHVDIKGADGETETRTTTEIIERELISAPAAANTDSNEQLRQESGHSPNSK